MKRITIVLLVLASVLLLVPASSACTLPSADAWLVIHSRTEAWLIIHRLSTVGRSAADIEPVEMDVCVAALNLFPGVLEVTSASLVDSKTGEEIHQLAFAPSDEISALFARVTTPIGKGVPGIAPIERWAGFIANLEGTLVGGREVDLMFDLKIDPNVNPRQLARSFNEVGAYSAGALGDDNRPLPGHWFVQRPHEIGLMIEREAREPRDKEQ